MASGGQDSRDPIAPMDAIITLWAYAFPWLAVALAGGDKIETPVKLHLGDHE